LATTRPERINSFEVGYKSVLLDNKLVIDFDAYTNVYSGFLGQVEVAVPQNNNVQVGTDEAVLAMLAANRNQQQTRYRVYTNAKNRYNNYGSSLGLTYNFFGKFIASGNVNYNDIVANTERDVFVTGFNTPRWTTNLSVGNREVAKNLGFNVVWRWQDAFLWESPLANGDGAGLPDLRRPGDVPGAGPQNHREKRVGPTCSTGGTSSTRPARPSEGCTTWPSPWMGC
jgi:hypothetical protein